MNQSSHTSIYASNEHTRHHMPVFGRLALSAAFFFAPLMVMKAFGSSALLSCVVAGLFWASVEGLLLYRRRSKLARLKAQAEDSYQTLHVLQEEEMKLRIAEARKSGAFTRFDHNSDNPSGSKQGQE